MMINQKLKIAIWPMLFLLFWAKAAVFLDPDFGWRLKAGEMYLNFGIPKTDPFSYTMPDFPWVDHAWSLSLLISLGYKYLGYIGDALIFAAFPLIALYFVYRISKRKLVFPLLLAASILFTFSGVRVQTVSWLMLSVLMYVVYFPKLWLRLRLLLPAFFFVWANLHGSFLSGLFTVSLFFILKSWRYKRLYICEFILIVVASLSTFLNPYGFGTWREVWSSVSDASLRFKIVEWMPALTMFDLAMVFLFGISSTLLLKYWKKFLLEERVIYLFFTLQALTSRRHLPLWIIFATPVAIKGIDFVRREAKTFKKGLERFEKLNEFGWFMALGILLLNIILAANESYSISESKFYPKEAVIFLQNNLPEGEVFSEYGWGGYLIWKLPQKKVFIDGRVPSWRWKNPPSDNLVSSFDTYNEILAGKTDYKEVFKKFNVDIVLWRKQKKTTPLDELYEHLEKYLKIFGWEPSVFNFSEALEKDGWERIYEDAVAVIYRAPQD